MSETERRSVTVHSDGINFARNSSAGKLVIKHRDGSFVLLTEDGTLVAESKSDSSLATWAFTKNGVSSIQSDYDLRLGDAGR